MQERKPLQPVARICHHRVRNAQPVAFRQRPLAGRAYNFAGALDAGSTRVAIARPRH